MFARPLLLSLALAFAVVAIAFSRVFLAASKTGATVAGSIATVIIFGGAVLASRVSLKPALMRSVVVFLGVAVLAAGIVGAAAGERDFLEQLAKGYAYKEIADRMNISIDTVRSYVRTVYEKLHVHSRTEAVVKFLRSEGTR